MNKLNTYFAPIEISMLPEYLGSGFIGLLSSVEPDSDIQSMGYPNVSVLEELDNVAQIVCFEINTNQTAIKSKKETYKYLMLEGPISISNIIRIIFFDKDVKDNFVASFSMLPDIPIDLFELVVYEKKKKHKVSKSKPSKIKQSITSLHVNKLTSLNIGIVELYKKLDLNFSFTSKEKNITPHVICNEIIATILTQLPLSKDIDSYEFQLLHLYIHSIKKLGRTDNGELLNNRSSSQEIIKEMSLHASSSEPTELMGNTENINPIIPRILDKTQNILLGIESPTELNDKERILQRAVFLASISDNHDALKHSIDSLNAGKIVSAIAELLVLFRDRTNYLSANLWRNDRQEFDKYLLLSERIANSQSYSINSSKTENKVDFGAQSTLVINGLEISSKEIKPDPELMIVVERLKTFKFNPKPGAKGSININVLKNNIKVPLVVSLESCPITTEKRNFIISGIIPNIAQLMDKKITRNKLLQITHRHMVSIGIINQDLEISRYQLADTMDRDELQHHIELLSTAYSALFNKFDLN